MDAIEISGRPTFSGTLPDLRLEGLYPPNVAKAFILRTCQFQSYDDDPCPRAFYFGWSGSRCRKGIMPNRYLDRVVLLLVILTRTSLIPAQVKVTTYHNDNRRTGQNLQETILTTSNVNATKFGKLFSQPLDGFTYAQPLYVSNVVIPNQGTHNVVYVATMNDSVYAFDADNNTGSNSQPLWKVNFTNPAQGVTTVPTSDLHCVDPVTTQVGIMSTPVIDTITGTLYVVARTLESGTYYHRLHALDIATGEERFGGPVAIQATASGEGAGSIEGKITFNPLLQNQRSALLLQNGLIYIAWGSLCDYGQYHGWIMTYNATTLAKTAVWVTTPNGSKAGVWQAGNGPAAGDYNDVFVSVGNGTYDVNTGGTDYGQSVLRLGPPAGGMLSVKDYFTPYNVASYNTSDLDIGSSGLMLLPDQITGPHPHLLVQGDKKGNLYLINRNNMGHFNSSNNKQIVQFITAATPGMWSSPSWWNNNVYVGGSGDFLRAFSFNPTTGLLSPTSTSQTYLRYSYPGTTVSISSNGTSNGIVWALNNGQWAQGGGVASLHAYDATNLSKQLYTTVTNAARDNPGGGPIKFTVPTVANGKVYFTTQTNLAVYGLLGQPPVR